MMEAMAMFAKLKLKFQRADIGEMLGIATLVVVSILIAANLAMLAYILTK